MQVFTDRTPPPEGFGPSIVAIGKFDGVHIGHRALLARIVQLATQQDAAAVAVTFDRNPLALLRPELSPEPLVSNAQKLELLAGAGIDATLLLAFDEARSQQPAEAFVDEVLVGALDARCVLVGSDFRFGARGAGDVDLLRRRGAERGFAVELVDDIAVPVAATSVGAATTASGTATASGTTTADAATEAAPTSRRASSTWVRELLQAGDVRAAGELLGRAPTVRSTVVRGAQRGRELGYPTANLDPARLEGFIPADGVYAAWLTVDGIRYGAAVSVGDNPTFDGVPAKQVEAYALDANVDLYDRVAEVAFIDRIRPMLKFDGIDALVERMADDVVRTRSALAAGA